MSSRQQRFTEYMEDVDSYIKHQMGGHTEEERRAFREKQIAMYNDTLEKYAEKLKKALSRSIL